MVFNSFLPPLFSLCARKILMDSPVLFLPGALHSDKVAKILMVEQWGCELTGRELRKCKNQLPELIFNLMLACNYEDFRLSTQRQ